MVSNLAGLIQAALRDTCKAVEILASAPARGVAQEQRLAIDIIRW